MAGKPCKACGKTAYPLESLQAGDDTYHKGCFKCAKCNIKLNLKTFKKHSQKIWCNTCTPKEKHTQVPDSVVTKTALSAPKTDKAKGVHKADEKVAPKMASFHQDKQIQSGEFQSEAQASTADTGIGKGAVRQSESGEFQSNAQASTADTGIHGTAVQAVQSGEFESTPQPHYADTAGHGGQVRDSESGEFASTPTSYH
mmetsp:Transcript_730/g.909  ORF Transcript_730/g.909 Transcript_730/m.909 type:complete len:199 (-) Transcript_730:62-658(-)|eukprot:CAMPEP_0174261458 /NCGR_PEP_ID=MMETSP0439-20130205/11441_1 /TAXON_ID=0 /ORGANISM="Stereomyxa ramosa, Strain Chinc5" /LENGTH=198 /DNA_ID=CAMNT_0015345939 /DNA_START=99 /DNA_END=695 /DNA_ORIENTATION=+